MQKNWLFPVNDTLDCLKPQFLGPYNTLTSILMHSFLLKVFMDELNTSSCMGLFKEMIVDKSFEGEVLYGYVVVNYVKLQFLIASTIKHIFGCCL